ncbi:MAG: hypothetical protein V7606_3570, partial [Burkholderiales bacterium]
AGLSEAQVINEAARLLLPPRKV